MECQTDFFCLFVCLFVFEAVGEVTISGGNVKALGLLEESFHTCVPIL